MTDHIIQELQLFQQYTSQLHGLIARIQEDMPQSAEGEDAQGAVRVRVGQDGLPESVAAVRDWQRRRGPEQIGGAVVEAYGSTVAELMSAQSQVLSSSGWRERADGLQQDTNSSQSSADLTQPPEVSQRDLRHVVPRSIDEVAEEMISSFDDLTRQDPAAVERIQVQGSDSTGRVTMTLSPGSLAGCAVDPGWAAKQSAVGLNRAFDEALRDARSALTRAVEANTAGGENRQLDTLLDEALAILSDPRRITDF
ncbi:hypothetical protein ACWEQN_35875 [Streptomyces sp. NPDC004129]|uniref:hypothetical protein n=1 Tax=Streptomyces sp. NPDC004533 TaxID=3154278 RepID=UPI0033AF2969